MEFRIPGWPETREAHSEVVIYSPRLKPRLAYKKEHLCQLSPTEASKVSSQFITLT